MKSAASSRSVTSTLRCCQKDRLLLDFLCFETRFSAKILVQVTNQGLFRIVSTRVDLFRERSIDFVPRIRILIVKNIQKVLFIMIFIDN